MLKNYSDHFKKEVLEEICRMFFSGTLKDEVNRLPFNIIPKGSGPRFRCCVYKERAILNLRAMAAIGFSVNEVDEAVPPNEYIDMGPSVPKTPGKLLTILESACKACVKSRFMVSELCHGCLSRKCETSCNFRAVTVEKRKAHIDQEKCKSCGLCLKSCPYGAIVKVTVPCEEACPANAIKKDAKGLAKIDHSLCISCGRCIEACPFGAVMERGQILDVLKLLKSGGAVAIMAPSIAGQFNVSMGKLRTALKELGFKYVYESALGADITAQLETAEFKERVMENGEKFMTSACCPAYVRLVKKHVPELLPFVSATPSPMHFTAQVAKAEHRDLSTVFIGPCLGRRKEAVDDKFVDYAINFEELSAMFNGKGLNPAEMAETFADTEASPEGVHFEMKGGVCAAVEKLGSDVIFLKPQIMDGLERLDIFKLKAYVKGTPHFNFLEAMCCKGGCVGGCNTLRDSDEATKEMHAYAKGLKKEESR